MRSPPSGRSGSPPRPTVPSSSSCSSSPSSDPCFAATVSSEEVARGKPAPDVYLEAASRLGVEPERCAAVEDSTNGLFSASAAGMAVFAAPNREFPPSDDALAVADDVLGSIAELTPAAGPRRQAAT